MIFLAAYTKNKRSEINPATFFLKSINYSYPVNILDFVSNLDLNLQRAEE